MRVQSVTWDRFAIVAASIFAVGILGCLAPMWIKVADVPFPPAIGLVAFVPLFVAYATAIRSVVTLDERGITGLGWGSRLVPWSEIATAGVANGVLQVIPKNPAVYIRSPHLIRLRPGVSSRAMAVCIDPVMKDPVLAALARYLPSPSS